MDRSLEEIVRDIVDERYSELDMMHCEYARGTKESEAWHAGVSEMWRILKLIKQPAVEWLKDHPTPAPVQGEELPELDVTDEDRVGTENLCGTGSRLGVCHNELRATEAQRNCRTRQLRAAYAEIKRLSQPAAGLPERPQRTSERFVSSYPVEQTEACFAALEKEVARLRSEVKDYEECYIGSKRLVRELDVAMHGADNAAPQASLCDLVGPAEDLRNRAEAAELSLSASRADALKAIDDVALGYKTEREHELLEAYAGRVRQAILARMEKAS